MLSNTSLSKDFHKSEIRADLSKFIEKVNQYHVLDPVLEAVNEFQDTRQHDPGELLAILLEILGVKSIKYKQRTFCSSCKPSRVFELEEKIYKLNSNHFGSAIQSSIKSPFNKTDEEH